MSIGGGITSAGVNDATVNVPSALMSADDSAETVEREARMGLLRLRAQQIQHRAFDRAVCRTIGKIIIGRRQLW
jgi:hypothetical protein